MAQSVILKYCSGQEIKRGDRVLFHGNPAEIEAVATASFCDPDNAETAWHVREFGGGVLIFDPIASGRTFLDAESIPEYEDLEFISRAKAPE